MAEKITPRATNYSQWYLDIVKEAGLADNSDVRGCMVIKPHGYAIWEKMQRGLDRLFKDTGHVNAYFPLFIPMSFLAKEEQMAEGFAKECAVVTHYRLKAEDGQAAARRSRRRSSKKPLIIRPTSETIIWNTYKNWIQSYRDLPLLINQWCNVVRWEMRTRLFLRTAEFLWQEGHTAHATAEGGRGRDAARWSTCIASSPRSGWRCRCSSGPKTRRAEVPRRGLHAVHRGDDAGRQGAAGRHQPLPRPELRQGVRRDVQEREEPARSSPGRRAGASSTRLIGGLIMTHSDDNGLVVPPRLAPLHVVIVPLGKTEAERKPSIAAAEKLAAGTARPARATTSSATNRSR